jgi:hypothetical protein
MTTLDTVPKKKSESSGGDRQELVHIGREQRLALDRQDRLLKSVSPGRLLKTAVNE